MYKTSFTLASVLALADALYLKQCCDTCCNDGDDDVSDETQDLIDEIVDNDFIVPPLDDGELVGGEGTGEPCATMAQYDFLEPTGLTADQVITADEAIAKINFQYMNDYWSRQEAKHWFNWLGAADEDDDDMVTYDDMVRVC